jgi:hypothetical protein
MCRLGGQVYNNLSSANWITQILLQQDILYHTKTTSQILAPAYTHHTLARASSSCGWLLSTASLLNWTTLHSVTVAGQLSFIYGFYHGKYERREYTAMF